jgi:VWFA-related protein
MARTVSVLALVNLTRLMFCLAVASLAVQAQSAKPRMVCLFLDLNAMDAPAQASARDNAIQYVQQLIAPSDIVEVMTYTSRLNVIQDFTSDQDSLVAALRTISPSAADSAAASNSTAAANDDLSHAQLQAVQTAVSSLSRFPERKAMIYFSAPSHESSANQGEEFKNAMNAAVRANVAIYAFDSHGLTLPRQ